jgi:hypothetical protein
MERFYPRCSREGIVNLADAGQLIAVKAIRRRLTRASSRPSAKNSGGRLMPDRWADKVMNIYIKQSLEDDPIFFQGLMRLVSDAIRRVNPEDVFLVRTDNYFDVKWFAFAGKVKVGINTGIPAINSKIQAVWKIGVDVTIPPFVPHRIVEQTHIKLCGWLSHAGGSRLSPCPSSSEEAQFPEYTQPPYRPLPIRTVYLVLVKVIE